MDFLLLVVTFRKHKLWTLFEIYWLQKYFFTWKAAFFQQRKKRNTILQALEKLAAKANTENAVTLLI